MRLLLNFRFWLALLASASYILVLSDIANGGDSPRSRSQGIYIWQRDWNSEVSDAIRKAPPQADFLAVLAEEIKWQGSDAYSQKVAQDWKALKRSGLPITLVIRSNVFRGDFTEESGYVFASLAGTLLAQAKANGLKEVSIQIDFDCPESKLSGYTNWLKQLRTHLSHTKIGITALPCWLQHEQFTQLVKFCDYYVLQVHSLERPESPDSPVKICNTTDTQIWINQTQKISKPFFISLPTYGYLLAFDKSKRFIGLSAEGPMHEWPAESIVKIVRSNPEELSALAAKIMNGNIRNCLGIFWFRLPVKTDTLNWPLSTLQAAMQGKAPQNIFKLKLNFPQPQLAEVTLYNNGETELTNLPETVVHYNNIMPVALDGYNSFKGKINDAGKIIFTQKSSPLLQRLLPGKSIKIGWIRFNDNVDLKEISVESR